jgi:gas vesicle protein
MVGWGMDNVSDFQKLLKIYEAIPKTKHEPSYLDICSYSARRFEEICSRILAFYFRPKKEHCFGTLFIDALFEVLGDHDSNYQDTNINVETEENAEGKRIDIFITSELWTIGIENKIGASVYNPLEDYKKRIEQEKTPKNYKIVLTLHEPSKDDLKKIKENEFTTVLYTDFFKAIKNRIGNFIKDGNAKYLVFLYDFIQTLEYMREGNIMSSELDRFFSEYKDRLEDLLKLYQEYKQKKEEKVTDKIFEIKEKIIEATHDEWTTPFNWYLVFSKNIRDIGVEGEFKEENNDPTAYFQISLRSWTHTHWDKYKDKLIELYPDIKPVHNGTDHFIYMEKIKGVEENKILEKLKECYNVIKNLE